MKILDRVMRRIGYGKIQKRSGNAFHAAAINRLTSDWNVAQLSPDSAIWKDIKALKARSRDLERNNDYVRKFLLDAEKNVIGSAGIGLQMKVKNPDAIVNGKLVKGGYDRLANDQIETAWYEFCKRRTFTVTRKMGSLTACRLILRSILRDGECLVRKVKGFDNDWGFSIQLIESDLLDVDYSSVPQKGNKIKMGVELNQWDEPVAYHILQSHPGDLFSAGGSEQYRGRVRVPAAEILHPFVPDRIGQTRGYPWMVSTLLRTQLLGGFEDAHVIAAQSGAATMGFFKRTTPEGWGGETDPQGNLIQQVEPGLIIDMPMGVEFQSHIPNAPNPQYAEFRKGVLRGIASGLGVSYNNLSGDYESVNYSSLRAAALDDREVWKMLQAFFIEEVIQEIFTPWLEMAMFAGKITLPVRKLAKFNNPEWKPRRWDWVDPLNDVEASIKEVQHGFKSARSIISEGGGDIEDVYQEISEDEALAEEYDIELGIDKEASAEVTVATAQAEATAANKPERE